VDCPGDGLATAIELDDDAAALDEDAGEAFWPPPQPAIAVPTTIVAAARPTTQLRATSMGVPSAGLR